MPSRRVVARELGALLKLLSHPERILIIQLLASRGEHRVGSIARELAIPETRTSQHLSGLRSQRIVIERAEGRERVYKLAQPELARWLVDGVDFVAGRVSEVSTPQIEEARRLWSEAFEPL